MWYIVNVLKEEPTADWEFKFYIIGIDTTGSNEIRVLNLLKYRLIVD